MRFEITTPELVVGVVLFLASTVLTSAAVSAYLVSIPADHFVAHHRGVSRRLRSPVVQLMWRVGKNLLGLFLVALGIVLALPGVPGQGLLTILVGLLMMDLPGKRRLQMALLQRRTILNGINRLRARFNRPELLLESAPPQSTRAIDHDPPSEPPDVAEP